MANLLPFYMSLLTAFSVSVDTLAAGFAYGANKIKIPALSALIIQTVCGLILLLSMLIGEKFKILIPLNMTKYISFGILLILGIIKLCECIIKLQMKNRSDKTLSFSALNFNFILHIYANPIEADMDKSRVLSAGEAASLAAALSIDGIAVGIGAAIAGVEMLYTAFFSVIINLAALCIGSLAGQKLSQKINMDLSWVSGTALILLAFLRV